MWSYGVTLWEMYALGEQPFDGMSGQQSADLVARGGRLARPPGCQADVYALMLRCWSVDPSLRPTFHEVRFSFHSTR